MKNEVLSFLVPKSEDALLVDCTLGEGGHSEAFLQKYPSLRVIGIDRDRSIQEKARSRLSGFGARFQAVNAWFNDFWDSYNGEDADLVLFDLGISMFHFVESGRGFSLRNSEKLDMRLDLDAPVSAMDIVNRYDEKSLADVIYNYGEERYSRRIAAAICDMRKTGRIETTKDLADIVFRAVPKEYRYKRIHPATKTFQALRIEVNKELTRIEPALEGAMKHLKRGGRIAVITFHSLEDRIVKWFFRQRTETLEILTKKPVIPTEEECETNSASRSAKLRVVEKR